MDFTPETYAVWARERFIPVASEVTRDCLSEQMALYHPVTILEIGAAIGSTTCRLGTQCAAWDGSVIAFEISYPTYQLARRRRNHCQCRNVHLYHADIADYDISLVINRHIDFVFIDGMKAEYANYLHQIRPFCRSGTCIIMDDVRSYADKMDALRQYLSQECLNREFIDLKDGDGIVKIIL